MKTALISVSDKTNLIPFATKLVALGYRIISTGNTARTLKESGVECIGISDITGFAECLDGRVKTLHPSIHAGLLARRESPEHMQQLKTLGINTIDLVAVNLYPFKKTIEKPQCALDDAIENIDIGGPAMLRSAAKNYQSVTVLCQPSDYDEAIRRIETDTNDCDYRFSLMQKVFAHTAAYDATISEYMREQMGNQDYEQSLTLSFTKAQSLRYGENPHQSAAFYADAISKPDSLAAATKLNGKELSYNNINDTAAALEALREFDSPAVVALKHANPCGVCQANSIYDAYMGAYMCDPMSIFGGIVALNRTVDLKTAEEMSRIFLEIIIAPDFEPEALALLQKKENLRVLRLSSINAPRTHSHYEIKKIYGGMLIGKPDDILFDQSDLKIVTKAAPSESDLCQLNFAYKVVKHVKSNAIVIAKDFMSVGIGAGQTNRIWAATQAIEHSGKRALNAYAASDAFFPFPDCVEAFASAGIKAIIQPGGSKRDDESIAACNKHNIAMVFVNTRHFRH